jgi:DNA-binding CsgD family transcriptional regulator
MPECTMLCVDSDEFSSAELSLVEAAGGDVVLLTELRAGLREEGITVTGDRPRTPRRVRELVRGRLPSAGAPGESWRLLRVAAVLGRRFDVSELASMMRRSVVELLPAVDALLDGGVLEWAGERLAFRTELVWWAVLDALPPAMLTALRADLDRIRGASRPASAPAYGDELSRAVALVRAALGRPEAAGLSGDLHGLLANLFLLKGHGAAARAAAEQVRAAPDDRRGDDAAATRLVALALSGDPTAGPEAEALLAGAPPSSARAGAAALVLSDLLWEKGKLAESLRLARHSAGSGGPHWWLWQRLGLISKLGLLRMLDEANTVMRATQAEFETRKLQSYEGNRAIVEAQLLLAAGQLAAADTYAKTGVAAARRAGSPLLLPHGLAVRAAVAMRAGDLDTATLLVAECESVRSAADCLPSTVYTWVALRLAERRHGPRRAVAMAADPAGRLPLLAGEPDAAPWLVRAALAAEDIGLARTVAGEAEELAAGNPGFPTLVAAAAHARACLTGEPAGGSAEWSSFSEVEQAIARFVAQGMTNRQIATRVRLSPHTVNYHLRVLFRKLGISSRAELVRHVPHSTAA